MKHNFEIEVVGKNEINLKQVKDAIEQDRKESATKRQEAYRKGVDFHQKRTTIFTGTKIVLTAEHEQQKSPEGVTIRYGK